MPTLAIPKFGCLWSRPRLERLVDGSPDARPGRLAVSHVTRCADCRAQVEHLQRLRALVRESEASVVEPDWSGFWPAVSRRIGAEHPKPVRDAWWLPYWKPVWGHPRVALGGLAISTLVALLVLWPSAETTMPALASPVQVQDVSATDPDRSVMVYSNPDDDVTVIWMFTSTDPDEQS